MKKKISLLLGLITLSLFTHHLHAQIIGGPSGAAYVPGYYVNIGVAGQGGFEGADTNAYSAAGTISGLHPRSNTQYMGFVANPQINNWASFDGDFFTPGTPENGWGIELGSSFGTKASNNRASPYEIPGSITNWQYLNGCYIVDWDGDYIGSGYNVHVSIRYQLKQDDLYYTTSVKIINNGAANIPEVYYYRNVDPDNNVTLSGDYSTFNSLVSQPSGTCGKALVSAEQYVPSHSYMGFAAIGPDYRVCYGGFSNRDGSDLWNASGFTGTPGSTNTGDEAIAISHRTQNLAPGDTTDIKFVVILDATQAENAISSLFYFDYAGGLGAPKPLCSNFQDTVLSCMGKSVHIELLGQNIADFTWTWSPTTDLDVSTGTVVNASPGTTTTYTITGTPIGGCFTVPVIQEIVVAMDTTSDIEFTIDAIQPICANNNGSLEVVGLTGGIGPVTVQWTGGPGTNLYDNLYSGIYEVMLTDSFGCFKDSILYLENITPMTATLTLDSMAICDHPSGQITALGANATAPYNYILDSTTSNTTGIFSGLAAGYYVVGIQDQNDCLIFESIEVPDTSFVETTATTDPETCGSGNGEAVITVANGNLPINYDIGTGPQTSNIFSSLGAGTYEAFITDNYGCTDSVSFTITDSSTLVAALIDTNSVSCDPTGSVEVTATGGETSGVYTYTIPGHGTQSTGLFTGLPVGPYTMTVSSGTCSVNVPFNITSFNAFLATLVDTNAAHCTDPDGSVLVTAANGSASGVYTFSVPGHGTQATGNFTGLPAGTYNMTVVSGTCTTTVAFVIGLDPGDLSLAPGSLTDENCGLHNGALDVNVTGGNVPYEFTINGFVTTQPDSAFTGLNDGAYVVGVSDVNGCIDTVHMTIGEIPITIDLGEDVIYCNSYTIPGQGVGDYLWSTGATTHDITVTQNGTYWLMVSTPECMAMDTINITFLEHPAIDPPNVFTPNGDGHNEKFVVDGMFVSTYHIAIFNRWGLEVFSSDNINESWDGKAKNGNPADEGVYMYIIEYDNPCESPTLQARHGTVQLLR